MSLKNNQPKNLKTPVLVYNEFSELPRQQELILVCLFVLYDSSPFIIDVSKDEEYLRDYGSLVQGGFIQELENEDDDEDYEGVKAGILTEKACNYLQALSEEED